MSTPIIISTRNPYDLFLSGTVLMEGSRILVNFNRFHVLQIKDRDTFLALGQTEHVEIKFHPNSGTGERVRDLFIQYEAEKNHKIQTDFISEQRKNEKLESKFTLFQNILKTKYANDLSLKGLKEVQKINNSLWLYFQQNTDGIKWMAGQPEEEVNYAYELLCEHLDKIQILKIFKDLQSANPFTEPATLWIQARATYQLLKEQGIETHY